MTPPFAIGASPTGLLPACCSGSISLFPRAGAQDRRWHLNTERPLRGRSAMRSAANGGTKGYATEALCTVRDYWFDTVGADWLAAVHANENIASSAVLQKGRLCLRP